MKKTVPGFVCCCGLLLVCGPVRSAPFLVEDGQPRAEIIIAEAPARMTKLAARELQAYVEKISGAVLPIVTEPTGEAVRIYVGVSAHTRALGLETEGLQYGAYRMASGADWLALLGPDRDYVPMEPWSRTFGDRHRAQKEWDELTPGDHFGFPYTRAYLGYCPELDVWLRDDGGTFNAVCEYLRGLGVRWYFPGELGEVLPRQASVVLPAANKTVQPDFPCRMPSYWRSRPETILWTLRLGGCAGQELHGTSQMCHGQKYVIMRDEVKQAHPEWYALWNGKRAVDHSYSGAPCLSSEGLFQQHLKFVRWMYDERGEPMVSLDLPDGTAQACQCPLCAGKGTPERGWSGAVSDYVFEYIDRVATELQATHPDRKVSALSYSAYQLPPRKVERFSPNLALWMCQWRSRFHDRAARAQMLELRREWLALLSSREIYTYDYYLHNCERYGYEGLPVYYPRLIAEDLRSLKGISKGELFEVYLHSDPSKFAWDALAVNHLNIYVTLRLLWDADLDLDALLDEFYGLFYGPAAAPMQAFIEYSEKAWPSMQRNIESIDEALRLLAVAHTAVDPESAYGRRVALVGSYLDLLRERRETLTTYQQDAPVVRIGEHTGEGLLIDGRLEEAFWADLTPHALRDLETGEPVAAQASFRAVWNLADRSLVLGIRCEEPRMEELVASATQHGDPALFNDDAIELFFETPLHAFYQIVVNTQGFVMDLDRKDGLNSLWSAEAEVATYRGSDFWSLEIRIPSADHAGGGLDPLKKVNGTKPISEEPWYFNVCRHRPRGQQSEMSTFSPTGKRRFAVPSKFAMLVVE